MDLGGAALLQELGLVVQLRTADDGVVDEDEPLVLDEFRDGDELHAGDHIALRLDGRHEGTGPGRRIFDEGAFEGDAGLVGITDRVGRAGVRDTGDHVGVIGGQAVAAGHVLTALVPHGLDGDTLVFGGRIAVVDPQERADLHFIAGFHQYGDAVRGQDVDLPGTYGPIVFITKVQECKGFGGGDVPILLLTDEDGGPSPLVTGHIDALRSHDHQRQRAVDALLRVTDAVDEVLLLIDEGRDQLGGIDHAAAHLHEVGAAVLHDLFGQLVRVVDLTDGRDGIRAVVRADQQRLRLVVGDDADAEVAPHRVDIFFEFRTERRVLDVVDGAVKALLAIHDHTGTSRTQM